MEISNDIEHFMILYIIRGIMYHNREKTSTSSLHKHH